jgi:hypothetical protein
VNSLSSIDIVDEAAYLGQRILEITLLGQIGFFFLDSPNDAFGIAVLTRLANCRHTDLHSGCPQGLDILGHRTSHTQLIPFGQCAGDGIEQGEVDI